MSCSRTVFSAVALFIIAVLLAGLSMIAGSEAADIPPGAWHYYKEYKSKAHYRAFVCTRREPRGGWTCGYSWAHSTVESAIKTAMERCEAAKRAKYDVHFPCKLRVIGDIEVSRMNEEQLDKAIALYNVHRTATNEDLKGGVAALLQKSPAALLRGNAQGAFEKYLDYRHRKAFASNLATGRHGWSRGYERPERAVARALRECGAAPPCKLYAIGNIVVVDLSDEEIDAATAFYEFDRLAFYGSNTDATRDELREWMTQTTPAKLLAVAAVGQAHTAKELLDQGVDVNATDDIGDTVLMRAVAGGYVETVEVLLSRGADVNAKNNGGVTALDRAEIALEFGRQLSDQEAERYRKIIRMLKNAGAQE